MGASKKQDWREVHCYRAWKLKQQGWKQNDIARVLGVTEGPSVNGSHEAASKESQRFRYIQVQAHRRVSSSEQVEDLQTLLARGAAKRLHMEQLPGYAPDLNSQEGIWNLLKRRQLKNVCCRDLDELTQKFLWAKGRLRHRRSAILACFTYAACPL